MIINLKQNMTKRLEELLRQEKFTNKEIYQFFKRVKLAAYIPAFTPKEVRFFMTYGIRCEKDNFDIIPEEVKRGSLQTETEER